MKWLNLLAVVFIVAGCGTAHHAVKVEDQQAFGVDTKVIVGEVFNVSGETFEFDAEAMLRDALVGALKAKELLGEAGSRTNLTMNARIIEYQMGSAFKRWLWPGYGSTILVVESEILDAEGNVDATAQASRSIDFGGGYTIGAYESIFKEVANDLVTDLKDQVAK